MLSIKKRSAKKCEKFQGKLRENNFSSKEIEQILPIYKLISLLSSIFISKLIFYVLAIVLIILGNTVDAMEKFSTAFNAVGGAMIGVAEIFSLVFSIILVIRIFASANALIRKHVLLWAILSFIPLISFVTFFVMKWKVSHIYNKRK